MNIIIDARMVTENFHGIGRYTYELVNNLKEIKDIKIKLLVSDNSFIKKCIQGGDIEYIYLKANPLSIMEQFELPLKLNKYKNEAIFHSPSIISSPFISCSTIITIHDLNHLKFPQYYTSLHRIYYTYILKPTALKSKRILTVSEFSKKEIVDWLKCNDEKVTVTYNGIDERFRVIKDNKTLSYVKEKYNLPSKFILYVGNLKPHKNIDTLVRAMKGINNEIPLVINGEKNNSLSTIIRINQLDNKVKFIGYVDDNDLPVLYNLAELFVYPSLYEGFGLPPLEAMACGCPVITSNTSSLPEVVGDAAIIIDPHNVEELSEAINKLLSDQGLRNVMIQNGLRNAQRFTWAKTTEETIKVYNEVYKNGVVL